VGTGVADLAGRVPQQGITDDCALSRPVPGEKLNVQDFEISYFVFHEILDTCSGRATVTEGNPNGRDHEGETE
jgi:hypothetical protein